MTKSGHNQVEVHLVRHNSQVRSLGKVCQAFQFLPREDTSDRIVWTAKDYKPGVWLKFRLHVGDIEMKTTILILAQRVSNDPATVVNDEIDQRPVGWRWRGNGFAGIGQYGYYAVDANNRTRRTKHHPLPRNAPVVARL